MMFTLPDLAYGYDALEPYIDAQTMELHHSKHHQTYVDKLNAAIKDTEHADKSIEELLQNLEALPETIRTVVRNNGGGHWNHSFFWESLSPKGTGKPEGKLAASIEAEFGSFDQLKEKMAQAGLTRFGSGWAWLFLDGDKKLRIGSTPNQDNPLMDVAEVKGFPILGLDVWEHAYYLRYQNKRPDYITAWWKVVNWNYVGSRYQSFI